MKIHITMHVCGQIKEKKKLTFISRTNGRPFGNNHKNNDDDGDGDNNNNNRQTNERTNTDTCQKTREKIKWFTLIIFLRKWMYANNIILYVWIFICSDLPIGWHIVLSTSFSIFLFIYHFLYFYAKHWMQKSKHAAHQQMSKEQIERMVSIK